MAISLLSKRTISAFPVSIGTSLALESLFTGRLPPYDPDRPIPQKMDISKYKYHLWCVDTLVRNFIGALEDKQAREDILSLTEEIANGVSDEMSIIQDIYASEGKGLCTPIFYRSEHSHIPKEILRQYKGKTLQLVHSMDLVAKYLKSHTAGIEFTRSHLPTLNGNVLITTHYAVDLLDRKRYRTMDLLESHTGILKSYTKWYTKYHPVGKRDLHRLPFNGYLLPIMGDNTLIKPMSITVRKQVLEIAEKYNWTPLTTESKVRDNLKKEGISDVVRI